MSDLMEGEMDSESWVSRYRQARHALSKAREALETEDQYLHERIMDWDSEPEQYLLIPSDFKARISAEADYKAAEQALSALLAEKYRELLG